MAEIKQPVEVTEIASKYLSTNDQYVTSAANNAVHSCTSGEIIIYGGNKGQVGTLKLVKDGDGSNDDDVVDHHNITFKLPTPVDAGERIEIYIGTTGVGKDVGDEDNTDAVPLQSNVGITTNVPASETIVFKHKLSSIAGTDTSIVNVGNTDTTNKTLAIGNVIKSGGGLTNRVNRIDKLMIGDSIVCTSLGTTKWLVEVNTATRATIAGAITKKTLARTVTIAPDTYNTKAF